MYKVPNIKQSRYDAASEIEFINGLGTYGSAEKDGENKKSRRELLWNYLIAAKMRVNWGAIDKTLVIQHVQTCLTEHNLN